MSQPIDTRLTATLVVHGSTATVFAAVGAPVPPDARMGIAEQIARAALIGQPIVPSSGGAMRPAFRLATSPGR